MRPSRLILATIALAVVAVAAPAWAEEIIHFTNGTTMPIRGHEIKGDMIHVDLGGDSSMAFPMSMVEKVEEAGKDVQLDPGSSGNRRFGGPHPVTGTVPSRYSDSENKMPVNDGKGDPNVQTDGNGVAVYRPYSGSGQANKAQLGVTGDGRVANGSSRYAGTTRKGNRHIIGGVPHPAAKKGKPQVIGFDQKPTGAKPPSKNPAGDGEGGDSSTDDGSDQ